MGSNSISRGAWIAGAVGLILHLAFVVSLIFGFLNPLFVEAQQGYGQASDFYGIYQAGANLIAGYSIYDSPDYRQEAPQVVPFYYFYRYLPPTAYGAALIAAGMGPRPAYWLWVVLNELLMAVMVVLLLRDRRWSLSKRRICAGLWLGCFPFYIEQFMGQFSFTMACLLYGLWRLDGNRREPAGDRAGEGSFLQAPRREWWIRVLWAASATLKSFTALLAIPYLRDGRWRRVVAAGSLGVLVCAPYFVLRPHDLVEFARLNFSPFMRVYKGAFGLQTALRDLAQRLPDALVHEPFRILGRSVDGERVGLVVVSGLIFAAALWATWRLARHPHRRTLDLALWTTVFFLVFKSVWEYHYVMMLPVVTAIYLTFGSRVVLLLGVWISLPTLYAAAPWLGGVAASDPLELWPGTFRSLHFSVKALPTLLLWFWILRAAVAPTRETVGLEVAAER